MTIDGATWQTWTDSGGDYAVTRTVKARDGSAQSVLVVGYGPRTTRSREPAEPVTGPSRLTLVAPA